MGRQFFSNIYSPTAGLGSLLMKPLGSPGGYLYLVVISVIRIAYPLTLNAVM